MANQVQILNVAVWISHNTKLFVKVQTHLFSLQVCVNE